MSNSIHVGSSADSLTDLSGASYGVTLLKMAWPWMAGSDAFMHDLPQGNRRVLLVNSMRGRVEVFPLRIEGTSNSNLRSKVEAIKRLVDPRLGNIYVKSDVWSDYLFFGRFTSPWPGPYRGQLVTNIQAEFTNKWADLLSTTETTQNVTVSGSPQAFNVPASGSVAGSSPAEPQWIIKNTSGSVSGAIRLVNNTTDESFYLATGASIPNGTWLRLDRERWTVETSVNSGSTWSDASALVGSLKNIPRLNPGGVNSCTLSNLSSGTVSVIYRARYM